MASNTQLRDALQHALLVFNLLAEAAPTETAEVRAIAKREAETIRKLLNL